MHWFNYLIVKTKLGKIFIIIIVVLLAVLTQFLAVYYFPQAHDLLRHLYYLPILTGGYLFGLRGGIITSGTVSLAFMIHMNIHGMFSPVENLLQAVFFIFIGIFSGYYTDKNKEAGLMQFKSRMDFFKGLSNVMDSRDKYTEGHSSRVANIARLIGSRMKLDDRQLDNLYQAGLLHDIGKIGIPDNILKKHDKLDPAEYELIKKHPLISESIMGDIEAFREIHDAVKHHHEKMDGTGYPDRLKGSEIPVFSRIISIADALDAMTSHRGYSNKKNIKEAISIIETMAGTQFDPEIVMILAPLADSLDSLSETNSTFEIDPVCKMKITPATAAKKLRTRDGICYFCSKDCYNIYIKKFR